MSSLKISINANQYLLSQYSHNRGVIDLTILNTINIHKNPLELSVSLKAIFDIMLNDTYLKKFNKNCIKMDTINIGDSYIHCPSNPSLGFKLILNNPLFNSIKISGKETKKEFLNYIKEQTLSYLKLIEIPKNKIFNYISDTLFDAHQYIPIKSTSHAIGTKEKLFLNTLLEKDYQHIFPTISTLFFHQSFIQENLLDKLLSYVDKNSEQIIHNISQSNNFAHFKLKVLVFNTVSLQQINSHLGFINNNQEPIKNETNYIQTLNHLDYNKLETIYKFFQPQNNKQTFKNKP